MPTLVPLAPPDHVLPQLLWIMITGPQLAFGIVGMPASFFQKGVKVLQYHCALEGLFLFLFIITAAPLILQLHQERIRMVRSNDVELSCPGANTSRSKNFPLVILTPSSHKEGSMTA